MLGEDALDASGAEVALLGLDASREAALLQAYLPQQLTEAEVEARFGGMLNAFKFGAPPHGGLAPGIDRIVRLLADTPNIREIIAFCRSAPLAA